MFPLHLILWLFFREEHESLQHEENLKKAAEMKQAQEQLEKEETLKRQIQQALNEQTFDQFRNYAEQQYPGNLFRIQVNEI